MKKKLVAILLMTIITPTLSAQLKTNFHSRNYVGLLEGDAGTSWQLLLINGLQRRSWFAGLGTGLDFYRYRTVPLFFSVTKSIKPTGNGFYVLSDAGINFAWINKEARSRFNDFISDKFTPSLYWNAGIGYKTPLRIKENALHINLAYSYKHLKETKEVPVFCITAPCPPSIEEYNYQLKRVSIKLGWEF